MRTDEADSNGKEIAAYHQYHAVNKAVESTKRATAAAHLLRKTL